jgi:hypothetical protein
MTKRTLRPMSEKPEVDAVYPVKYGLHTPFSRWHAGQWCYTADSAGEARDECNRSVQIYEDNGGIDGWYNEPQFIEAAAPAKREIRVGDRVRLSTDDKHADVREMYGLLGTVQKVTHVDPDETIRAGGWWWLASACELVSEDEPSNYGMGRHIPADPIDPNAGMIARDGAAKPRKAAPAPEPTAPTSTALPPNPNLLTSWSPGRWF